MVLYRCVDRSAVPFLLTNLRVCGHCRLTEIGPRMTLQLIKIEEGVGSGEILYHEYIKKSPEEVRAAEEMRKQKK